MERLIQLRAEKEPTTSSNALQEVPDDISQEETLQAVASINQEQAWNQVSIEESIDETPMINQEPIQKSSEEPLEELIDVSIVEPMEELIEESLEEPTEDPPSIKQVSHGPDLPDFQTLLDLSLDNEELRDDMVLNIPWNFIPL